MTRVCLVILFNHAFVDNIPKLDRIYGGRFRRIIYLVPFVRSSDPRVITAYWGSYTFQGYVSDALEALAAADCEGFLFLHDDAMLNPEIHEGNVGEYIPLRAGESFIPEPMSLAAPDCHWGSPTFWNWNTRVLLNLLAPRECTVGSGAENIAAHLPPVDFAQKRMLEEGIETGPITIDTVAMQKTGFRVDAFLWKYLTRSQDGAFTIAPPYPMARAISDFFLVPRSILADFAHYCGVFAAGNIFVEAAIPTALVLASTRVVACADLKRRVDWRWGRPAEQFRAFTAIADVFDFFTPDLLAIHPIKLSRIEVP